MKDIFEQFNKEKEKIYLLPDEKFALRTRISAFLSDQSSKNDRRKVSGISLIFDKIFSLKLRPMFIALFIALALGGGTALAAENALPGDTLYPVKIYVNEQVRDALEVSAEKQAEWDLKKAERRLLEAEKLAQQGKLNAASRADIESRIQENIDRVNEFRDRGETGEVQRGLGINLGAMLRAHGDILESLMSLNTSNTPRLELRSILNSIRLHTSSTINTSSLTYADNGVESAALNKLNAAEKKMVEVESFVSRKWIGYSGTSTTGTATFSLETRVRAKLQQARDFITQGKLKFDEGLYREAFDLFQNSMGAAQQAKILVATVQELKLDIRLEREEDRNTTSTNERGSNVNEGRGGYDDREDKNKKPDANNGRGNSDTDKREPVSTINGSVNIRIR